MRAFAVAIYLCGCAIFLCGCGGGSTTTPAPAPQPAPLRGCGVPVEQVRLAVSAGDATASGKMNIAFLGGSDAVKVEWMRLPPEIKGTVAPQRVVGYDGFNNRSYIGGQRLMNVATMSGLIPGMYSYVIVDDPATFPNFTCAAKYDVFAGVFTVGIKGSVVKLAVLGDMGANFQSPHGGCFGTNACHGGKRVKELLEAEAVTYYDLIYNIGDIAYAAGIDGLWDDYGREISKITANVPWMVAVGNHEWGHNAGCECGTPYSFRFPMPVNDGAGIDYSKRRAKVCHTTQHGPKDPPCPGADDARAFSWKDMAYSVDIGDVRIVTVSTQHGIMPDTEQFAWLKQKLTTDQKKWQIVVGHIDACWPCDPLNPDGKDPCYCWADGGPAGPWGATSMTVVQKLIDTHKLPADLLLAGHTHEYYVRNCKSMPACNVEEGVPLIIVGGAGYGEEEHPGDLGKDRGQCSYAPYGYIELEFNADAIGVQYRSVADTGNPQFDNLSCNKNSTSQCPAVAGTTAPGPDRCTPASFTVSKTSKAKATISV